MLSLPRLLLICHAVTLTLLITLLITPAISPPLFRLYSMSRSTPYATVTPPATAMSRCCRHDITPCRDERAATWHTPHAPQCQLTRRALFFALPLSPSRCCLLSCAIAMPYAVHDISYVYIRCCATLPCYAFFSPFSATPLFFATC